MGQWISEGWLVLKAFALVHGGEFLTIIALYVGFTFMIAILRILFLKSWQKRLPAQQNKRLRTIARLLSTVAHVMVVGAMLVWILRIFGIDPSPILASAGIVGLAVGFGAQTLVRDFLTGMFIIVENQYGVGDVVRINDYEGIVKSLSIRSTRLEDKDGSDIFIPNGSISVVVNVKK
jgi:small-conductance mechanosensitive channel